MVRRLSTVGLYGYLSHGPCSPPNGCAHVLLGDNISAAISATKFYPPRLAERDATPSLSFATLPLARPKLLGHLARLRVRIARELASTVC